MSKVTAKRQVTIPKHLADEYEIFPGDRLEWIRAGDGIRVVLAGRSGGELTTEERLKLFDRATERVNARLSGGGPSGGPPPHPWLAPRRR